MPAVEKIYSICDIDDGSEARMDRVRIKGIFSPTGMHGDVLRNGACSEKVLATFGYENARGAVSGEFRKAIDGSLLSINEVEYEVDVSGELVRDEDGLWLKILSVRQFRELQEGPR